MLERTTILTALRSRLEPLAYVHAMWEGGAPAFNRTDAWSDIDLQIVADDDQVDQTLAEVETVLADLCPIELKYDLPRPTWHGHAQTFYRLRDAGPFLLIDLVVMKLSAQERFLTPEIHGQAVVHFDKAGLVQAPALDIKAHRVFLLQRLKTVRLLFDLFQSMVSKELHRHNWIEAQAFYQAYTLRPLVEVLGMVYRPARYNFGSRYVYYDFPAEISRRLEGYYFIADPRLLETLHSQAIQWFNQAALDAEETLARE